MFETISRGFKAAKSKLTGVAELTPENIDEALRDVRMSLLEADVEFKVTKRFLERVKEKAIGEQVNLRAKAGDRFLTATPDQHSVKICHDELAELMGPADASIAYSKKGPTAIMMVGLQGSGKTTTVGKLARYLQKNKKRPLLVAADVYRPAAITQLQTLGKQLGIPVYSEGTNVSPVTICTNAVTKATELRAGTIILDTAGRLHIDEALMGELVQIKAATQPADVLLVVDSMTG